MVFVHKMMNFFKMNLAGIMLHHVRYASEQQFQAGFFPKKNFPEKSPKPAKPYHFLIKHVSDMSVRLWLVSALSGRTAIPAVNGAPTAAKRSISTIRVTWRSHRPASPILRPLPQIVGPGANHSFAKLTPSVENAAAHQEPASVSAYRALGYLQKPRYFLPADQQIVFSHNLSSFC
jgi:hypothetical protein